MVDYEAYRKRKNYFHNSILTTILWGGFTSLVVILFFCVRYLMDNWADLTVEELIFHLKSTLGGTNPDMIRLAVFHYAIPALILLAILFAVIYLLRKKKKHKNLFMAVVFAADLIVLFAIKSELDQRIGLSEYVKRYLFNSGKDFIAENYVDINSVEITFPQKKRNLIFIFLESTEMTFSDRESGGAFEQNVIPELTELAMENEDFSGEEQVLNGAVAFPGCNWTMGAMFAMATGMPLKVPLNGNSISSEEEFFPRLGSLGTILQKQGYRQELLIGSEAVFGGRNYFYKGHGNFAIRDYTYMREHGRIPEDYYEFWGFEDEKLFEFAREDLLELAADGRPFNLTMLTVDTHFEDGYRCRLCRDDFGEQYADAFACSSRQVMEFVKWVQQQDFYENTTIVISGDHPTMDKDFCENVPGDYCRRTFVAVINGQIQDQDSWNPVYREYSTLDLFPTTLAAMNVKIEGDRLGLGVNLYAEEETLIEKYGIDVCEKELDMPSAFMDRLSGVKLSEDVLKTAWEYSRITAEYTDDDCVLVSLCDLGRTINYNYIDEVEIEILDTATQKSTAFFPEIVFLSENDPNNYYYSAKYDLNGGSAEDLEVLFYISAGDHTHYKIGNIKVADYLKE